MAELDYQQISELVSRAQDGDGKAFEELYLLTYRNLYRMACHYLHDPEIAQDAVQDTYMLVLKNLITLQNPRLFISWLDQILYRVCLATQRKQRQYDAEASEYDSADLNVLPRFADLMNPPEHLIVQIDQQHYIRQQIMSLPEQEAKIILLRYYHNLKINDIAAVLHISRATVNRKLAKARQRLREKIEP